MSLAVPQTFEMETSGQGFSNPQDTLTSESDLPGREVSPALPSAFNKDLATHCSKSHPFPSTCEGDSQTSDDESESEGGTPTVRDTMDQEMSLSTPSATTNNFSDQGFSPPVPHSSVTENLTLPLSSEKVLTQSCLNMAVSSASERLSVPLWRTNDSPDSTSRKVGTSTQQNSNRVSLPVSPKNDNTGLIPLRAVINALPTSKGFSVLASQKNDCMGLLSLRTENMSSISQRTHINKHPTSEGVCTPTISHPIQSAGSTSQMIDTTCSTSDMLYMLTPLMPLRAMPIVYSGSDRVCVSTAPNMNVFGPSQITNVMPQASEKPYMPSRFQMNEGTASGSTGIYIPAGAQRFYLQPHRKPGDDTS